MQPYHKACLHQLPTWAMFSHGEMAKEPCDWEHTGDTWRLIVYEYEGWLEYRGRRIDHKIGTAIILPPGAHFKQDRYGEELYLIYCNFKLADGIEDLVALPLVYEFGDAYTIFKSQWLQCVRRLQISRTPAYAVLFHYLWRMAEPLSKYRKHRAVEEAEEYFREHIESNIQLAEVAETCRISRNQLIRAFRQEHGVTPMSYLRTMRAEEAQRLLTTTDLPIKKVAQQVGIPSLQYFNRFINDYFGVGPRALRDDKS